MFKKIREAFSQVHPPKILVLGYLTYALIGWLVLSIPICHNVSVSFLDNLFIATSAMSTTGLTTVDVGTTYSIWGQIVILLLIQIGGLGYMTFSSFIVLTTTQHLSRFREKIATTALPLPKAFSIREFIIHVIWFTFVCELIGAIALSAIFMSRGIENCIWSGIFHSVSGFCTAGFSLFQNSFMDFKYDIWTNITLSALSILGAVGFIVWVDVYKRLIGEKNRLTFTTKVILFLTFSFLIIGTIIFFLVSNTPTGATTSYPKWITSFFQVMTASTTVGFNTVDIGSLTEGCIVLLVFLMVFGASPSGTGGGLKITTFAALVGLVKSTVAGKNTMSFWKREIPPKRLRLATATLAYYSFVMMIFVFFLVLSEHKAFLPTVFEAASALGTVGLSMGITSDLTHIGKILITLLMLMGRAGILTFGIALAIHGKEEERYLKDNELVF